MKIVSVEEFIKMPAGTIFAPCDDDGLSGEFEIRVEDSYKYNYGGEEMDGYFGTCPVMPHPKDRDVSNGFEFSIYDGSSADVIGEKCIAVFEEKDIDDLIKLLLWAKSGCNDSNLVNNIPGFKKAGES